MPGKAKKPAKAAAPPPQPVDDGPTIGEIMGLPTTPLPFAGNLAVTATFADEPDDLADPRALGAGNAAFPLAGSDQGHRPGENEPPPGSRPEEPDPAKGDPETQEPVEIPEEPEEDDEEDDLHILPDEKEDEGPLEKPAAGLAAQDDSDMAKLNAERQRIYDEQRGRMGIPVKPTKTPQGLEGEILPPGSNVRYESRIQIVEAYRYAGRIDVNTPAWIDRNWIGYGDDDPLRNIPAGPCLRVPLNPRDSSNVVLARIGDWVCQQSVTIDGQRQPELRVEVWPGDQFQRMFVPVYGTRIDQSEKRFKSSPPQKPGTKGGARRAA